MMVLISGLNGASKSDGVDRLIAANRTAALR